MSEQTAPPSEPRKLLRGLNPTPPELLAAIPAASEHLVDPFPAPTYPIDVTGGITDWGMMGNDEYGDCVAVAEVHGEMSTAAAAGTAGPPPDSPLAVERYVAATGVSEPPGPGLDPGSYLLWLYQQGAIKAFAKLDPANKAEVDAAMAAGYGVLVAVSLTDDAQQVFEAGSGQPFESRPAWNVDSGQQPDPMDGHGIWKVRATGPGDDDLDGYVTWAELMAAKVSWSKACVIEVYLVATTEEQAAKFAPSLLDAIEKLGGTGGQPDSNEPPAPVPTPAPAPPAPPPLPVPGTHDPFRAIEDVAEEFVDELKLWWDQATHWHRAASDWHAEHVAPTEEEETS